MDYCQNCGNELVAGSNFCHKCGFPINSEQSSNRERSQEYAGKIVKCPSCGEQLNSSASFCPSCGYELRGAKAPDAIKEFERKFNEAKTLYEKTDLITTFSIPNTHEDIREFMILAASNINVGDSHVKMGRVEIRLSNAWRAKLDQAYEKSKILFGDSPIFYELQGIYTKKMTDIRLSKKAIARATLWKGIKKPLLIMICMAIMGALIVVPPLIKTQRLEKLVTQAKEYIDAGDYDTAQVIANQIVDDSYLWFKDEKWDTIRTSLLELIDEKRMAADGKIYVNLSAESLIGKNYKDVVKQLQEVGFTNIQLTRDKDLITGWVTGNGAVEEVSIAGNTAFTEKSSYKPDVEIVVTYHAFKFASE